ncbi:5-methyltetrahydrofolate--homocysteine methyltransferase [Caldanaerovirga acetigignens]|uniref:Methionine synthase n=1 Tax=Caldanaerovirga acetigignens TaxID=447595 RepID=A0A1M7LSR0_9FIRM|nr:homocysteine S-methyltransferase family protein [Caldanaerovirga acetigignens]SHM81200.1 5-methyltetrahydrofolate--homocysteine methyltransferase [Caldanaerovirga acetigignens]
MRSIELIELLKEKILIFDGAMGTMLFKNGLPPGSCPEMLNLEFPNAVENVHRFYVDAGAEVVETNTFGANRIKLSTFGLAHKAKDINHRAVEIARKAAGTKVLVAGSIGPTGKLIFPLGDLSFEEAYTAFKEQAGYLLEAGADLIIIETMSDLQEMRAALLAVKEFGDVPVICQMTFEKSGRTLTGTDPETAARVLSAMGATVVGLNCSLGPEEAIEIIKKMAKVGGVYLSAQPNAGLPDTKGGAESYAVTPEDMAKYAREMVRLGVSVVGGCCGTTPEHIKAISEAVSDLRPPLRFPDGRCFLACRTRTLYIEGRGPTPFVGERINPTARKKLAESIKNGDFGPVIREAEEQVRAGASIIDVNVGVPGLDEASAMARAVESIQRTVDVPLSIDSSNPEAIEAGLKYFCGRAIINSVDGSKDKLEKILPLARRYGAALIGLTLDESGIPESAEKRLKVAQKIVECAEKYGIDRNFIFIDCLCLAAGVHQNQTLETLKAISLIKKELGVKTTLGISNISHGLPFRKTLNAAFLSMAIKEGLDLPIIDPLSEEVVYALRASDLLTGRDERGEYYVFSGRLEKTSETTLKDAVINGNAENIKALVDLALKNGNSPLDVINEMVIPALEEVGKKYETGEFFLPQLIAAAEAAEMAFSHLRPLIGAEKQKSHGTVVLATVRGDIHDIGKNIVKLMLSNNGFHVVDLGVDVPEEKIIEAAVSSNADIIGLSALMTTTMVRMKDVVDLAKSRGIPAKIMVGGAVVTEEFAKMIGADGYAPDAVSAVYLAKKLVKLSR